MNKNDLNEHRFFDPDKTVRELAYELYLRVKDLPIISPHGHVDPKLLAENKPFPDPTELILIPDHYLFRMLYSQGIPLESLGIPSIDNTEVEKDHRKIWQIFADNFYLFDERLQEYGFNMNFPKFSVSGINYTHRTRWLFMIKCKKN